MLTTSASLTDERNNRGGVNGALRVLQDETDRVIVAALVADGRTTLKTLSDATGLSISAVQARVRRLDAEGVTRGYTALIDPEAIRLPLAAFVAITPLDPCTQDDIPARIADLTEVESCHSVAGDDAFVLFVRVSSPVALEELIQEIRRRANVTTHTTFVLRTFFERRAHPLVTAGKPPARSVTSSPSA